MLASRSCRTTAEILCYGSLGGKSLEIELHEYPRGWELPCVPPLPLRGQCISGSCPALGSSVTSPCLPSEFGVSPAAVSLWAGRAQNPSGCISPTYPSRFPPLGRSPALASSSGDALSCEPRWPRGLVPPVAGLERGQA